MSDAPRQVALAELDLPAFGEPGIEPTIPAAAYAQRMAQAMERAAEHGQQPLPANIRDYVGRLVTP